THGQARREAPRPAQTNPDAAAEHPRQLPPRPCQPRNPRAPDSRTRPRDAPRWWHHDACGGSFDNTSPESPSPSDPCSRGGIGSCPCIDSPSESLWRTSRSRLASAGACWFGSGRSWFESCQMVVSNQGEVRIRVSTQNRTPYANRSGGHSREPHTRVTTPPGLPEPLRNRTMDPGSHHCFEKLCVTAT